MFFSDHEKNTTPIIPVSPESLPQWLSDKPDSWQNWVQKNNFQAKNHQFCLIPSSDGQIDHILLGVENNADITWALAKLSSQLPAGDYRVDSHWTEQEITQAMIGWGLGAYTFDAFQSEKTFEDTPHIYVPPQLFTRVTSFINAIYLVRDLINTPANHMMPEQLSNVMAKLARQFGANFSEIVGDALLEENFPAIHAVGRASQHPPRYLEMTWGDTTHPRLTLIGKGVCFDSGGLDIKPSRFMRLMKKDMGGAAHALGLASLIMENNLAINLRVLIPAVENAISGDAFRPGDVLETRSCKTIEIDNTDAEGRLVLCDALSDAASQNPNLIIDFATLTGAARVALGTEVPVYFSNNEAIAKQLNQAAKSSGELVWQLPMYADYLHQLHSDVADILNCSPEGYGGAITAALFLNEFVPEEINWLHFDVMAWNNRERAGRPKGGEAMGLFTIFSYLETYFLLS